MNPLNKVLNSITTNVGNMGFSAMNQGGNVIAGMFDLVGSQVAKGFENLAGNAARNAKSTVYKTEKALERQYDKYLYTHKLADQRAHNMANAGFGSKQILNDRQIFNLLKQKLITKNNIQYNEALKNKAQSTIDLYDKTNKFLTENQRAIGGVAVGAGALGATGLGVAAYNAYND